MTVVVQAVCDGLDIDGFETAGGLEAGGSLEAACRFEAAGHGLEVACLSTSLKSWFFSQQNLCPI